MQNCSAEAKIKLQIHTPSVLWTEVTAFFHKKKLLCNDLDSPLEIDRLCSIVCGKSLIFFQSNVERDLTFHFSLIDKMGEVSTPCGNYRWLLRG